MTRYGKVDLKLTPPSAHTQAERSEVNLSPALQTGRELLPGQEGGLILKGGIALSWKQEVTSELNRSHTEQLKRTLPPSFPGLFVLRFSENTVRFGRNVWCTVKKEDRAETRTYTNIYDWSLQQWNCADAKKILAKIRIMQFDNDRVSHCRGFVHELHLKSG